MKTAFHCFFLIVISFGFEHMQCKSNMNIEIIDVHCFSESFYFTIRKGGMPECIAAPNCKYLCIPHSVIVCILADDKTLVM